MLGWLIGAGGMIAAFVMWWRAKNEARPVPLALPPSPLADRLWSLVSTARRIRYDGAALTAEDLLLCAPVGKLLRHDGGDMGASMVGVHWHRTPRGGDSVGPGRRMFLDLHEAIARVEPDDRRDLAEHGFDLRRLEMALEPVGEAESWRRQLYLEIEAMEKALTKVRDLPYR